MVEKSKSNYRVDRLTTIFLYEDEFNTNNKYIGKDMIQKAAKSRVLSKEQYGSRKKIAAILHALI